MSQQTAIANNSSKLKDYALFAKMRLASLVVFSAVICYCISVKEIDWFKLTMLTIGGFLVTASSNGFNQITEKDLDKLMDRTSNRPLPQGRMSVTEGYIVASVFGIAGIIILHIYINPLSALLGLLALFLYTVVYTPLKLKTPLAVFVGAFPGAMPPLLGCVAATEGFGSITPQAIVMFLTQFMWQFPHFWAIAWVMHDDYKKAGFHMLPSLGGRDKSSAFQTFIYALMLIPVSLMPVFFKMSGTASAVVIVMMGGYFAWQAYTLYKTQSIKAAQQLMFGSFVYLPVVQLAVLWG